MPDYPSLASGPSALAASSAGLPYFPALTGVRALAAYLVYWYHFNPFSTGVSSANSHSWAWALVTKFNNLGVAIFFVLSGFLIAVRYAAGSRLAAGGLSRYWWHRVARIYPLYLLLTCLTFSVFWQQPACDRYVGTWVSFSQTDKWAVVLLNMTLLRSFFEQFEYTGIAQGWSLTVEECFYIAAPALLLLARRLPKSLVMLPLLLLGMGWGLVALCTAYPVYGGFFATKDLMLSATFFGRSSEFIAGIWLAKQQQQQGFLTLATRWHLRAGLAALGLLLLTEVALPEAHWGATLTVRTVLMLNHAVLPMCIALVLYGLVTEQSRLRQVLELKISQLLGRSSYSFYLIHAGVIQIFLADYLTPNKLLLFCLLNLLAILLYAGIEKPLRVWLLARRGMPLAPHVAGS
ncbi:MAG: acyltransferase family protein [Janthinobacterium lividum]